MVNIKFFLKFLLIIMIPFCSYSKGKLSDCLQFPRYTGRIKYFAKDSIETRFLSKHSLIMLWEAASSELNSLFMSGTIEAKMFYMASSHEYRKFNKKEYRNVFMGKKYVLTITYFSLLKESEDGKIKEYEIHVATGIPNGVFDVYKIETVNENAHKEMNFSEYCKSAHVSCMKFERTII